MKSKIKRLLALVLCLTMILNGNVSLLASDEVAAEDQVVAEAVEEMMEEVTEEVTEEVAEEVAEEIVEEVVEEETIEEVTEEAEVQEVIEDVVEEVSLLELTWAEDGVTVTVSEKVAGAIPEGTTLSVTPIVEGEEYTAVETGLQEKAANEEYEIAGFLAYDICLVDASGNEIEPNDNVNVSIEYDEAVIPEMEIAEDAEIDVTVMHFEEDVNGEVSRVVDIVAEQNVKAAIVTTDDVEVEKVKFVTDSFSTYTVTWTYQNIDRNLVAQVVDINGNVISGANNIIIAEEKVLDEEYIFGIECAPISVNSENSNRKTYIFSTAILTTGTYAEGKDIYSFRFHNSGQGSVFQYKESLEGTWIDVQGEYRVYLVYEQKTALTTIETVNHETAGISIRLNDYNKGQNNLRDIEGTWNDGKIRYDVLKPVLDNGYPRATEGNLYLKDIFSEELGSGVISTQLVNHLFSKEIYDATGYYEYSSFNNYAYLDRTTNNFIVYDQIGTPNGGSSNDYLYQRGNFFPFNNIEAGKLSGKYNRYDDAGNRLTASSPRYNEPLYVTQPDAYTDTNKDSKLSNNPNFYFGMVIEADFIQPKDGMVEWKGTESPMRYEFNGDDDLWVFVDNALMLDIGGIHVAHEGYIDFSTGEIGWYDGANNAAQTKYTTTIKAMFEEAKIYPDGTAWGTGSRVSEFFEGNTFKDYSAHSFKMFYMERGDGASDLHVRFNIPTIPEGTFDVKKELGNTDKEKYANVEFAFQAFAQEVVSTDSKGVQTFSETEYVPLTNAVYKENNVATSKVIEFKNAQTINGTTYDNVFFLKPDEIAHFSDLQEDRKYYVVELGVDSQKYDDILINNTSFKEIDENENESAAINNAQTSKEMVSNRPLVVYSNQCSEANRRELRITKQMVGNQTSNDSFTFKVMLEDASGRLVPYVGPYYLQDAQGGYYKYVNGVLTGPQANAEVCGDTTADGYIRDVKVGFTAAITRILAETEFAVSEVDIDAQYVQNPTKVVTNCDATTMEGADGAIALGKHAQVVISNAYKKVEDKPFINVSKTFTGIDPEQNADLKDDFEIIVTNKEDATINATLKLTDKNVERVVNGNAITYTWLLDEYPAGTYVVEENNYEITDYQTTIVINGITSTDGSEEITTKAAELQFNTIKEIENCNITEHEVNGATLIISKLTEDAGCFVWSEHKLSVSERLAVVDYIKNTLKYDAKSDLSRCYFYSGDISDTLYFRGDEISYNGTILKFKATKQWSKFTICSFKETDAVSADIEFTNDYVEYKANLDLFKKTVNGTYVDGAEFKLSKLVNNTWVIQNKESIIVKNGTGLVELTELGNGLYMLEETKAPEGCSLLEDDIYFKVNLGVVSLCDEKGNNLNTTPTMWELTESGLTIKNEVVYSLPSTGSYGIYVYIFGGIALMAFATLILYKNRRKEVLAR